MITTEDIYYGGCDEQVPSAAAAFVAEAPAPDDEPRTFADLQGRMTFVQASNCPFNNAVSFSSTAQQRYAAAEVMPDGYDDSEAERRQLLALNPKDDNALLAPRREEIDEYIDASADLFRRQQTVASSNTRRLGARSTLWPALDEEDYGDDSDATAHKTEKRRSYANYSSCVEFDKRAEEAMSRASRGPAA